MEITFFAPETWALFIRLYRYNNIVYSCAPNPTLIHNPKRLHSVVAAADDTCMIDLILQRTRLIVTALLHLPLEGAHRWRNSGGKKSSSSSTYIITQNEALQPRHLVLQVYRKQTLLSRYFYIRYFKTDNFVFYTITFYAPLQTVS